MLFNSAPQDVKIRINPCNAINDQFKFKTTIPNNPTVNLYRLSNRDSYCKIDAQKRGKIHAETFQNPTKLGKNMAICKSKTTYFHSGLILKDDEWMTMTGDENGDDTVSVRTYTQSKCHPARLLLRTLLKNLKLKIDTLWHRLTVLHPPGQGD
jgi:hypothetical protein